MKVVNFEAIGEGLGVSLRLNSAFWGSVLSMFGEVSLFGRLDWNLFGFVGVC